MKTKRGFEISITADYVIRLSDPNEMLSMSLCQLVYTAWKLFTSVRQIIAKVLKVLETTSASTLLLCEYVAAGCRGRLDGFALCKKKIGRCTGVMAGVVACHAQVL